MSFDIDRKQWEEFRNEIAGRIKKHPNYNYVLQDIAIRLSDDVYQVYKVN